MGGHCHVYSHSASRQVYLRAGPLVVSQDPHLQYNFTSHMLCSHALGRLPNTTLEKANVVREIISGTETCSQYCTGQLRLLVPLHRTTI